MDVSIIITSYNYDKYIEECVESCLVQTNTKLSHEVIVVDDGSTDDTPHILESINSDALRKYRIENSGIEAASNFGFRKARGQFVVRVDADDKLLPGFLQNVQQFTGLKYDFIYPNYYVIDGDGIITETVYLPEFNPQEIKKRGDFLATGTLYSSRILEMMSYYDESLKNSGLENYELILRLLRDGRKGRHIPMTLFCYRRHNSSMSELQFQRIWKNGVQLFKQFEMGEYQTNENHPYNRNRR